jgi:glycosyltransferase involved in cell wall biosynthesis
LRGGEPWAAETKSRFFDGLTCLMVLKMKRVAIYAHFGESAKVALHVFHYLGEIRSLGFEICFVSNSLVSSESRAKLSMLCQKFIQRENNGYDFSMWQAGLAEYDLSKIDELLLTNSSIVGPFNLLSNLWQNPSLSECDFWGLTDNDEISPHLQSYFLVLHKNVIQSDCFAQFWKSLLAYTDKDQIIRSYEVGLTIWLKQNGFKCKCLYPQSEVFSRYRESIPQDDFEKNGLPGKNTTLFFPDILISTGMPFLKLSLLKDGSPRVSPKQAWALLQSAGFPNDIIEDLRASIHPKVSICIPTYNGREHLKECLESVRAQTFQNFEVIICDDQSSDGTLDFARELARGDERFHFIQNPRRFGLVGNWNNCIAVSHGEWVKFVFQDDIIAPNCIEKLLQSCEQTGKSFAFCARNFIFEMGINPLMREWCMNHQAELDLMYLKEPVIKAESVIQIAHQKPHANIVGEPTVTLIRRSVFEQVGLFDDTLIQLCDGEFWFRIMSNLGAVWVPERLATFRIHAKATTAANHGGRSYRTVILDSLVIRYRFAFDDHFSRLRSTRLPGKSVFGLKIECAVAAYRAWSKAKRSANSEPDMIKEWNAIILSCPRLPLLAKIGQLIATYYHVKWVAWQIVKKCGFARN